MVTDNEQLLKAIDSIFSSTQSDKKLTLDADQIEMLIMSDDNIQHGNMVS